MSKNKNKKVEVSCKTCNITWLKRKDTINIWKGNCCSCAQKEEGAKPYKIEIGRKNGINIIIRFGCVPNAVKFTSETSKGENNNNWKGGITSENKRIRQSTEYVEWRNKIFKRDNYTCQHCGKTNIKLHADHIKQFAFYPELRFDINNGRALCVDCHSKTPTYKSRYKI